MIVLGVLIALAADSFWESLGDRVRELEYMGALSDDVKEDERYVRDSIDGLRVEEAIGGRR